MVLAVRSALSRLLFISPSLLASATAGGARERLQARCGKAAVGYAELFPRVPVVFAGVSDRGLIQRMPERFCGIEEVFDRNSAVDRALRLHANARSVHLVVDDTPFAQALSSRFAGLEPHDPNVRFERQNGGRIAPQPARGSRGAERVGFR